MAVELAEGASPYDDFCRTLRSRGPTLNLLFEQARVSPEREGDTILRDAFSRAIVSVLHNMLREYWTAAGGTKNQWKRSEPLQNGCSIGQIFRAALDNSGERSMKILCTAFSIPAKKHSKHSPFRSGSVCWLVLEALGEPLGYGSIEAKVRQFASQVQTLHAG